MVGLIVFELLLDNVGVYHCWGCLIKFAFTQFTQFTQFSLSTFGALLNYYLLVKPSYLVAKCIPKFRVHGQHLSDKLKSIWPTWYNTLHKKPWYMSQKRTEPYRWPFIPYIFYWVLFLFTIARTKGIVSFAKGNENCIGPKTVILCWPVLRISFVWICIF